MCSQHFTKPKLRWSKTITEIHPKSENHKRFKHWTSFQRRVHHPRKTCEELVDEEICEVLKLWGLVHLHFSSLHDKARVSNIRFQPPGEFLGCWNLGKTLGRKDLIALKTNIFPWEMLVGRLFSVSSGPFSGDMWLFFWGGKCRWLFCPIKKNLPKVGKWVWVSSFNLRFW